MWAEGPVPERTWLRTSLFFCFFDAGVQFCGGHLMIHCGIINFINYLSYFLESTLTVPADHQISLYGTNVGGEKVQSECHETTSGRISGPL